MDIYFGLTQVKAFFTNDNQKYKLCILIIQCRGADPNIETPAGLTVLDFAHTFMEQDIMDLLESYGGRHGSNYSEEYMEEYLGDYSLY